MHLTLTTFKCHAAHFLCTMKNNGDSLKIWLQSKGHFEIKSQASGHQCQCKTILTTVDHGVDGCCSAGLPYLLTWLMASDGTVTFSQPQLQLDTSLFWQQVRPGEKYLHWNPKNICNTRTRYPSLTPSSWWRRRWTPTTRCSAPRGTSCPPTPARCGSLKSTRRTRTILCASSENNTHDIIIMTTMHDAYVVNYNDPPDPLFLEPDDFFFFLTAVPAISLLTMVSRLGSTSRHTLMGTWSGEHYQLCGKFTETAAVE